MSGPISGPCLIIDCCNWCHDMSQAHAMHNRRQQSQSESRGCCNCGKSRDGQSRDCCFSLTAAHRDCYVADYESMVPEVLIQTNPVTAKARGWGEFHKGPIITPARTLSFRARGSYSGAGLAISQTAACTQADGLIMNCSLHGLGIQHLLI